MLPELRKSRIDVLGDVAWGTHFCQFYQTREDLLELLVPYFAAGLENNEFCVWVVCPPLTEEDALQALQKNIPHFDRYLKKQSIELISYDRWFLADGKFDETFVANAFGDRYQSVLKDEDGNIITILSLTHDVTERKISEEKLNRSYEQIRSLSEHLRSVREEERKYVAREIHDELGQYLTVLKMDAGLLSKKLHNADAIVRTKLKALMALIDTIVHSVRRIASELRPSLLDDLGLTAAIEWHLEDFRKRTGIKTRFIEAPEELLVPEPLKTHLFRILQESLTNVAKHSGATEVRIDVMQSGNSIVLTIADDGVGFNPENLTNGRTLGILGMRENGHYAGHLRHCEPAGKRDHGIGVRAFS